MAVTDTDSHHNHEGADSDAPLPEDCYLSYLVPSSTAFDPKQALDTAGDSFANRLAAVEQRDQLFFGTRFASSLPTPRPPSSYPDFR